MPKSPDNDAHLAGSPGPSKGAGSRLKRWWLPVFLLVGLAVFFASGADQKIGWAVISENYTAIKAYADANLLTASLCFMAGYAIAVAFSLPISLLLTLTGGAIFGWLAIILVVSGATVGAGIVFIAARTAFADLARVRAGAFLARLEDGFTQNAFSYLLALRLIPAAPFWVINIIPALTRMSFSAFFLATFIGIIPGSTVFVAVGRSLNPVLAAGHFPDLKVLTSPAILGPLAALGVLALLPVIWPVIWPIIRRNIKGRGKK